MVVRRLIGRLGGMDLAKESGWGLGFELVSMLGTILSFTFLGRSLGPEGYGGYASLYAIVGPLVTLAASGVTLALLQHVIRDREPLSDVARSCLSLSLLLGALLTVVGIIVALVIVESMTATAIVTILVTEFVSVPLIQVGATAVQASSGFIGAAKIRLLLVLSRTVLLCALFAVGALSLTSLGIGSLVVTTLFALILLRQIGKARGFPMTPGRVHLSHLKSNGVYSVGISAGALNNDGDKLVMAANRLVVDTGLYAAAYRIVGLGMIPVGSALAVSHQRFLQHEEGNAGQHLRRSIRFAGITGFYGLIFAIVIVLFAPLLPLVIGDDFEGSVVMVRWLAPLVMLKALAMFALNGLMGLGRTMLRSGLIVVNAAVAMAMYIVLIPIHGWQGAAAATLITEAILVIASWTMLIVCQRKADRIIDAPAPVEATAVL